METWVHEDRDDAHLGAIYSCFAILDEVELHGLEGFGEGDPLGDVWRFLRTCREVEPSDRVPMLVWEALCLARLCNSPHLTLDLRWRWDVRAALLDTVAQLRAGAEDDAQVAEWGPLYPTARLEAAVAQAQLDMDLGRMEQAYSCFERAEREVPELQGDPDWKVARLMWDYSDRQYEFVRALPAVAPDADPALVELVELTRILETQARLHQLIERSYLEAIDPVEAENLVAEAAALVETRAPADFHALRLLQLMAIVTAEAQGSQRAGDWIAQVEERMKASEQGSGMNRVARLELDVTRARLAEREPEAEGASRDLDERLLANWDALAATWSAAPRPEGGIGFLFTKGRRNLFHHAVRASRRLGGDRGAFRTLVRTQALGAGVGSETELPSLERLTRELDRFDAGLLVFVPGDRQLLVCAVNGDGVSWFEGPPLHQIRGAARELTRSLREEREGSGSEARSTELADRVGQHLWTEALTDWLTRCDQVVVVGEELLEGFPLLAATLGDRGPLGFALPVTFSPSIPFWLAAAGRARERERGALEVLVSATGVGSTGPRGGELPPLPPVDWEGTAIALERAHILGGPEARLSKLTSELRPGAELLTILAHGVSDTRRLIPGGVLVSGEEPGAARVLWSEDLRELSVPPTCVLLVCRLAEGLSRLGDGGIATPPGALLGAGALSVLASQRDLEMSTAIELYAAWHRAWAAGASPAEALHAANLSLSASRGSAPFRAQLLQVYGAGVGG